MTYNELRATLPRTGAQKMPSAKELRETGKVDREHKVSADAKLTVYTNGYYTYFCGGRVTVYAVDRCGTLHYSFADASGESVDAGDMQWYIPLVQCAEERLAGNTQHREDEHKFSLENMPIEVGDDKAADPVEEVEFHVVRELLDAAINTLTLRQQEIVRAYFFAGKTQADVAEMLGISRPAVTKALNASYQKLGKVLREEGLE